MTIQVQTENRKALVKAISEQLGQEQHYDGPPSFNYRVGAITITRDCSLIGEPEDLEALKPFLEERGYLASERIEDGTEPQLDEPDFQNTEPEQIQESGPETQDVEPEPIQKPVQENSELIEPETSTAKPTAVEAEIDSDIQMIAITHTNAELTVASLTNLVFMLYSKQYLLGKALGQQTIHISDEVIQELQTQRPENMGVFIERIADFRDQELIIGFDFKDDMVSLTFPYCEDEPTHRMVYAQLVTRMIQKAKEATRVHPDLLIPESESEKYYMNGWLLRLGYGGADSKVQRRILMEKLQGYAAFKTTAGMDRHKEKYSAQRRAARAAQKVVTEDGE